MAVRRVVWVMLALLGAAVAGARGQVGPPVDAPAPIERARTPAQAVPPPAGEPVQRDTAPAATEAAARPAESSIPLMGARPDDPGARGGTRGPAGGGWTRSLASVALVVGLILVLAAVARFASRRTGSVGAMLGPGGRAPSGVLEVLARYPVARGQVLVLLRIDRRVLLMSQSTGAKAGGFTTLAQFDDPSEVAAILRQTRDEASESVSVRFRQALERFQGQDEGDEGVDRGEIIEVGPRGEPLPRGRGVWA